MPEITYDEHSVAGALLWRAEKAELEWEKALTERDELQARIDRALAVCESTSIDDDPVLDVIAILRGEGGE